MKFRKENVVSILKEIFLTTLFDSEKFFTVKKNIHLYHSLKKINFGRDSIMVIVEEDLGVLPIRLLVNLSLK